MQVTEYVACNLLIRLTWWSHRLASMHFIDTAYFKCVDCSSTNYWLPTGLTLFHQIFFVHVGKQPPHSSSRHGTKFWKFLKSQNFGHIDIDFDIENYSFKILILILILKFAFPKYWFWYWYWTFWEFWYWYWYWYWKKMVKILKICVVRKTQVPLWPWVLGLIFHSFPPWVLILFLGFWVLPSHFFLDFLIFSLFWV